MNKPENLGPELESEEYKRGMKLVDQVSKEHQKSEKEMLDAEERLRTATKKQIEEMNKLRKDIGYVKKLNDIVNK